MMLKIFKVKYVIRLLGLLLILSLPIVHKSGVQKIKFGYQFHYILAMESGESDLGGNSGNENSGSTNKGYGVSGSEEDNNAEQNSIDNLFGNDPHAYDTPPEDNDEYADWAFKEKDKKKDQDKEKGWLDKAWEWGSNKIERGWQNVKSWTKQTLDRSGTNQKAVNTAHVAGMTDRLARKRSRERNYNNAYERDAYERGYYDFGAPGSFSGNEEDLEGVGGNDRPIASSEFGVYNSKKSTSYNSNNVRQCLTFRTVVYDPRCEEIIKNYQAEIKSIEQMSFTDLQRFHYSLQKDINNLNAELRSLERQYEFASNAERQRIEREREVLKQERDKKQKQQVEIIDKIKHKPMPVNHRPVIDGNDLNEAANDRW